MKIFPAMAVVAATIISGCGTTQEQEMLCVDSVSGSECIPVSEISSADKEVLEFVEILRSMDAMGTPTDQN